MLDWNLYEQWFSGETTQLAATAAERAVLEDDAANILQLSVTSRAEFWGICSPPGRSAATVVHVLPGVSHAFADVARAVSVHAVGLKLFKTTSDGGRAGRAAVQFHDTLHDRLPGLPNVHVQLPLVAGALTTTSGIRHYVVQQWVGGDTLEALQRGHWSEVPPSSDEVCAILTQALRDIIVPLWSVGTVWWDIRDANLCWDRTSGRLTMIDVDSLAAYAHEIVETPAVWTRREKGRRTALTRLKTLAVRLLQARRLKPARARRELEVAWSDLELVLAALGRTRVNGPRAVDKFLSEFEHLAKAGGSG